MTAWIFDVDGVLTNLTAEKILLPEIPQIITEKLKKGEPVAFITGRSLAWLKETTLSKLNITNNITDQLFIAAEFGGVIAKYENDKIVSTYNKSYEVSSEIKEKASEIIKKYPDSIELEEKEMFFTSKIKTGASLEDFQNAQKSAVEELKILVADLHNDQLEVQSDSIGLSIRNKNANKSNCVRQLLSWLRERNFNPDKYIVFGDSPSDFEMADELQIKNLNFEFVFVGDKPEAQPNFPLTFTEGKHDEGTLEYLENHYV